MKPPLKFSIGNNITGEIIEFDVSTPEKVLESWRIASEYIKNYEYLKTLMKEMIPGFVDPRGLFEHDGYQFRVSNVQRYNYDKAVMREVLDPDVFDVLLKPDKPAVDKYIKENLETLGPASTELRRAMVAEGKPYQVIKLERLNGETENKNDTDIQLAHSK